MKKNKPSRTMIPFLLALVPLVACGHDGREPPRQTAVAVAHLGAGCLALDDFTSLASDWATLTVPPGGSGDITSNLQRAVDALSSPTVSGLLVGDVDGVGSLPISTPSSQRTRTIFIPHGDWTINATVNIRDANYINIVGEDPATTTIKWVGGTGGSATASYPDMFRIFDLNSMKLSRLTLDGNHQARMGVHLFQSSCYNTQGAYNASKQVRQDAIADPSWNPLVTPYPTVVYDHTSAGLKCDLTQAEMDATGGITAVTGLEFNDDVFKNLEFGLVAGQYGVSQAEVDFTVGVYPDALGSSTLGFSGSNAGDVVVRRSRFEDISALGVNTNGSNVFNWLVADSEFKHCFRGIQMSQHGGTHVINNHFEENGMSTWTNHYAAVGTPIYNGGSDIVANGDVGVVIRGNVSTGSRQFLDLWTFGQLSAHDVSENFIQTPYYATSPVAAPIVFAGTQVTFLDNFIQLLGFPASTSAARIPGVMLHGYGTWGYLGNIVRVTDGGNTFITSDPNATCAGSCGTIASPGAGCAFIESVGSLCERMPTSTTGGCAATPIVGSISAGVVHEIVADTNQCQTSTAVVPPDCSASNPALRPGVCDALSTAVTPVVAPSSGRAVFNAITIAPACGVAPAPGPSCADQINSWLAARSTTERPFLFFPVGPYYIDKPIEVPSNLDIVLGGDGVSTQLFWQGKTIGTTELYVFHLASPSKASIRDLSIFVNENNVAGTGMTHAGGILVDSTDDVGGLVYLDTFGASFAKSTFDVLGLDNVAVRADMSGGFEVERVIGVTGGGKAHPVLPGAPDDASSKTRGLLLVAGGSGSRASYAELKNWGKAVLIGVDNESNPQGMDLDQSGYLTLATGRYHTVKQSNPAFADQPNTIVDSTFRGRLTLMNLSATQAVLFATAATPEAKVLSLNNFYQDSGTQGANQPVVPSSCPNVNVDTDCSFFTKLSPTGAGTTQMQLQDGTRCLWTAAIPAVPAIPATPTSPAVPAVPAVAAGYGLAYCQDNKATGAGAVAATNAFVKTMLVDERAARMGPPDACSTTAVRIHRVKIQGTPSADPSKYMGPAVRVQRF
jgi:hypothetical protein